MKADGSFRMDMSYFNYCQGPTITSRKFDALFEGSLMLRCARHVRRETGLRNLVMTGGVALNCVGNGRILREADFDQIFVQPDALGAALFAKSSW